MRPTHFKHQLISKVLSTAVKLYLRSQISQIENLRVKIVGKNKQILQGYIPQVLLSCDRGVYRGLYLSQIELDGSNIAFNLPQVIKKKPLKLLEPVLVEIRLNLSEDNLQASLDSPLFQSGLNDLWQMILPTQTNTGLKPNNPTVKWHRIAIAQGRLNLTGIAKNSVEKTEELYLSTKLDLADERTLLLSALNITGKSFSQDEIQELKIDLGTDITFKELIVESQHIFCCGTIRINN